MQEFFQGQTGFTRAEGLGIELGLEPETTLELLLELIDAASLDSNSVPLVNISVNFNS